MPAHSSPAAESRTEPEARETLANARSSESLGHRFEAAVQNRRQELAAERRNMVNQIVGWEGAQPAEWLQGMDDLSPGSHDLLALTVLYPG